LFPLCDQRLEKLREAGRNNVEPIVAELDGVELPRDLDAVLFIRFYRDLFWQPRPDGALTDSPEFLRRVYESLKPGGGLPARGRIRSAAAPRGYPRLEHLHRQPRPPRHDRSFRTALRQAAGVTEGSDYPFIFSLFY
jgi:hypothetical protein